MNKKTNDLYLLICYTFYSIKKSYRNGEIEMKLFKKRAEKIDMKTFFNDIAVKIEQAVKTDMEQIKK